MFGTKLQVEEALTQLETSAVEEFVSDFKRILKKVYRKVKTFLCPVINGRHELYRARTDSRLFQQCLLCGYETKGWTIDRRDRRITLVKGRGPSAKNRTL